MPFTQVNGISMYYEVHGEHGSPLIVIQGLSANTSGWLPAHLERVVAKHRLVIFDNRGAGHTDKPAEPYTMAQFAADAVGLLDALEIDQAHVFGVSMGGMIAQHVALTYPQRVLGLVLGCTAAGGPGHPQLISPTDEVLAALMKPPSADPAQDVRDAWPLGYTPAYIEANRDLLEKQLEIYLSYPPVPPYVYALQMGAILQTHDTFACLGDIKQPTLVQAGLEDILVPPQNARILAEGIPKARLIEYPGVAHRYFEEMGLVAVDDILAFLAEVDSQR